MTTPRTADQAGTYTPAGTTLALHRLGYGAMQLAGPHVFGPPRDPEAALAVLHEAVALGVNHIDTSDFYGPHVTNRLIREALHPYRDGLTIVTKIGFARGADASWNVARSTKDLVDAVHGQPAQPRLDVLDVVNLRVPDDRGEPLADAIEAPLATLLELREQGLVNHVGLSNVVPAQYAAVARSRPWSACRTTTTSRIAATTTSSRRWPPTAWPTCRSFRSAGFRRCSRATLDAVAKALEATTMQVALAWLLQRSPNILLIPGTSSVTHLRENVQAVGLTIPADMLARLDAMA